MDREVGRKGCEQPNAGDKAVAECEIIKEMSDKARIQGFGFGNQQGVFYSRACLNIMM